MSPELTLRQVKRRVSRRPFSVETVGTVFPALPRLGGRDRHDILSTSTSAASYYHQIAGGCGGGDFRDLVLKDGTGKTRKEHHVTALVPGFSGASNRSAPLISWKFSPLPKETWYTAEKADHVEDLLRRLVHQM